MATIKQIEANRRNSKKSTGAKSEEGKTVASKNALKHGLLSNETILPWEDISTLDELRESMTSALKPEGALELILVDRIVSVTWRLRRAGRIESGIFAWRKYSLSLNCALTEMKSYIKSTFLIEPLEGFPDTITDQERYDEAATRVRESSMLANSEGPALGRTFVDDSISIATLSRYETSLEKSLYKALHELQRIQYSRQGEAVAAPVAIDIHGS